MERPCCSDTRQHSACSSAYNLWPRARLPLAAAGLAGGTLSYVSMFNMVKLRAWVGRGSDELQHLVVGVYKKARPISQCGRAAFGIAAIWVSRRDGIAAQVPFVHLTCLFGPFVLAKRGLCTADGVAMCAGAGRDGRHTRDGTSCSNDLTRNGCRWSRCTGGHVQNGELRRLCGEG